MIDEFLMPLERQFDSGFGATADTFHDAAKALDTDEHRRGFGFNCSKLPVFYLFRHAIELYFKSVLTILHRRFGQDFPQFRSDDFPEFSVASRAKKIFEVHSIDVLYRDFLQRLTENARQLETDWTAGTDDLSNWVSIIDAADQASTMFRYPFTKNTSTDAKKSSFKSINPANAIAQAHATKATTILGLKNSDDEIVETFIHDTTPLQEVFDALKNAAAILAGIQFGMSAELVGGYSRPF